MKNKILVVLSLFSILNIQAQINKEHFLNSGRHKLGENNYVGALEDFSLVIQYNPEDYFAYFLRGIVKYQLNDFIGAEYDFSRTLEYNPLHPHAFHYRGITRDRLGDYTNALDDYNKALERNPKKQNIYISRGFTKIKLEKYDEAIQDFNLAIKIDPELAIAYLNRALAYDALEEYQKALDDCNKAIKINFYLSDAFFQRARVKYNMENYTDAIEDINLAIKRNEKDARYYYFRALSKIKLEKREAALNDFNKVIELDPDNALSYYNRAIIKTQLKDYKGAIEDYGEVIKLNPRNILSYLNRGMIKHENDDFKGAIEDYSMAIELYPDFARAYMYRSDAKRQIKDFNGADKDYYIAQAKINEHNADSSMFGNIDSSYYEKIIELKADFETANIDNGRIQDKDIFISPEEMFNLTFYQKENDYIEATKKNYKAENPLLEGFDVIKGVFLVYTTHDSIIQLEDAGGILDSVKASIAKDEEPLLYFANGIINSKLQNYYSAINFYNKAIDQKAGLDFVYNNRGVLKYKNIEALNEENSYIETIKLGEDISIEQGEKEFDKKIDYSTSMNDFNLALAINPRFSYAYYNRAYLYQRMGKYDESIENYNRAIENNPELKEAYFNRGLLLIYLNDTKKACLDLSKAGELGLEKVYNVIKRYCND